MGPSADGPEKIYRRSLGPMCNGHSDLAIWKGRYMGYRINIHSHVSRRGTDMGWGLPFSFTNFGQLISSGETFIPVSCKTLTYILLPLVFILTQCASFVCCLVLLISSAIQWYIKHKANLCVVILESKQVTPTFKKWIREDVNVIYLSSFGMCACWHVRYTRPECGKLLYGCLNFIICNWAELPGFSRMYI